MKIGIDLGGTKIEIVALNEANQVLLRQRIPTLQEQGYDAILERIANLYFSVLMALPQEVHTLGIGIPGAISARSGLVKNSNTRCLNGRALHQDLQVKLNYRLVVENDANCFVLAEALLGAGRGAATVFGVIVGTGCGGGIVVDGRLHLGRQLIAGEWGHMQIDPRGPECYCGKRGCVETYISGSGLQAEYQRRFGIMRTVEEMITGFRSGNPADKVIIQEFLGHYGTAMANFIGIFDPDVIVLGGGLSKIDELYSLGREAVEREIFSDELTTPIVKNQLGDSAGVFGAALVGAERHLL